MYFSRQMAQSDVELLLRESNAPQLLSRWPLTFALNFRVSIFSRAWMAILFIELWMEKRQWENKGCDKDVQNKQFLKNCFCSCLLCPPWEDTVYLAASLLQFDFDEEDEAHQRHHDEERQENPHVEIFSGLQTISKEQFTDRILSNSQHIKYGAIINKYS